MSIQVKGIDATSAAFRRIGKKTTSAALRESRKGMKAIRDRARDYAPVDEGNLEAAIELEEFVDGRRKAWIVGVDVEQLGPGYQKTGFRYDIAMHEGVYKLGPLSEAKGGAAAGVGPKYLERAVREIKPEIEKNIRSAIKRGLK